MTILFILLLIIIQIAAEATANCVTSLNAGQSADSVHYEVYGDFTWPNSTNWSFMGILGPSYGSNGYAWGRYPTLLSYVTTSPSTIIDSVVIIINPTHSQTLSGSNTLDVTINAVKYSFVCTSTGPCSGLFGPFNGAGSMGVIVFTFLNGVGSFYYNGGFVGSHNFATTTPTGSGKLVFFNYQTSYDTYDTSTSYILQCGQELALWNRALSSAEIMNLFANYPCLSDDSLMYYWTFGPTVQPTTCSSTSSVPNVAPQSKNLPSLQAVAGVLYQGYFEIYASSSNSNSFVRSPGTRCPCGPQQSLSTGFTTGTCPSSSASPTLANGLLCNLACNSTTTASNSSTSAMTVMCEDGLYYPSPASSISTTVCAANCASPPTFPANTQSGSCNSNFPSFSSCNLTCASNFQQIGSLSVQCNSGQWSAATGYCSGPCNSPALNNGFALGTCSNGLTLNQQSCQLSCDSTHTLSLSGNSMITCNNGVWTSPSSTCESNCATLTPTSTVSNSVAGNCTSNYPSHSSCVLSCEKNYAPMGSLFVSCNDGVWGTPSGTCASAFSCSPLTPLPSGFTLGTCSDTYTISGESCGLTCDSTHTLSTSNKDVGEAIINCKDGNWSSITLSCNSNCADPPINLISNSAVGNCTHNYPSGSSCSLSCKKGYHSNVDIIVSCLNSQWTLQHDDGGSCKIAFINVSQLITIPLSSSAKILTLTGLFLIVLGFILFLIALRINRQSFFTFFSSSSNGGLSSKTSQPLRIMLLLLSISSFCSSLAVLTDTVHRNRHNLLSTFIVAFNIFVFAPIILNASLSLYNIQLYVAEKTQNRDWVRRNLGSVSLFTFFSFFNVENILLINMHIGNWSLFCGPNASQDFIDWVEMSSLISILGGHLPLVVLQIILAHEMHDITFIVGISLMFGILSTAIAIIRRLLLYVIVADQDKARPVFSMVTLVDN